MSGGTGFTGGEDAGIIHYSKLRPQDAWALRVRSGQFLSSRHPEPRRKLVDFRPPPRDPAKLRQRRYFVGKPAPAGRWGAGASGESRAITLQGGSAVRDAIIDPEFPDRNFGNVRRDNRLKRRDDCNAFLIRFDLSKLDAPQGKELAKAALHFSVWDPSNRGKLKVHAFPVLTEWDDTTATWQQQHLRLNWRSRVALAARQAQGSPSLRGILTSCRMML